MSNDKRVGVLARIIVACGALALMLVMVGDGRIAAQASTSVGIDPLEILNLQIKPNVLVVLDSSGSMQETVTGIGTGSGDHPRSKMYQAKQVLKQVMAQNANRVTFLFGQYQQPFYDPNTSTTGSKLGSLRGTAGDRFQYTTDNVISPSMATTELTIAMEPPPSNNVVVEAGVNNQLRFTERTDTTNRAYYDCTINVPVGTYVSDVDMTSLATSLTASLQLASYSPSCVKYQGTASTQTLQNSYQVQWDAGNRWFTIKRSSGSNAFQMRLASGTGGLATSVGPAMKLAANIPNQSMPGPTTTNINATTFADSYWCGGPTSPACTLNGGAFTSTAGVASRGFQAFQDIRSTWNTFYFSETSGTTKNCVMTIPTGFRRTGEELAKDLEIAMNSCTVRPGTPNTYSVTFAPTTGKFTFTRATGSNNFTLQWATTANSIGPALAAGTANQGPGGGPYTTANNSIRLLRRSLSDDVTEGTLTTYHLIAGKYFNGETVKVMAGGTADGVLCDVSAPTAPENPPVVFLQQVAACDGANVGAPVKWTFAGGTFGGNNSSCNGFSSKVPLTNCDQTQGQLTLINPFLNTELDHNADGTIKDYIEATDGSFAMQPIDAAHPGERPGKTGGIKADGSTPISKSLQDIKGLFTTLWNSGQATPFASPLKNHTNPKEQTIVIFVTDGDDTCASPTSGSPNDDEAKAAALSAQQLFTPIDTTQPSPNASSVSTYMIGFGSGASVDRLNWIAWGGSGLGQNKPGQPAVATNPATQWDTNLTAVQLQALRNLCPGCHDAYIAPDAATLAAVIEGIIDRGASVGQFTAQQSVVAPVYEDVAEVGGTFGGEAFHPGNPDTRYFAVVPTLFRSSFQLPGFWGSLSAITNQKDATGNPVSFSRWDAGQVLLNAVKYGPGRGSASSTGMSSCGDDLVANSGNCIFSSLVGKIQRHIYTSGTNSTGIGRNGVFPVAMSNYFDTNWLRTDGNRLALWPPGSAIDPATGTAGTLDSQLGLTGMTFATLQSTFGACMGTSAPTGCGTAGATQLGIAMKEAREIVLAYMAGAQLVLDNAGNPRRVASGGNAGQLLYQSKPWVLAEGTLGAPAVLPPPVEVSPLTFSTEYQLFRDGPRDSNNIAANGLDVGFGIRNPDNDATFAAKTSPRTPDTRTTLKPVMTVVYMPANDMLHAFRAGPSVANSALPVLSPAANNCTASVTVDCGGEELWGFVPYDQLDKLQQLLAPQSHSNATYVVAAGIRFTDVFVPNTGTTGNYDGSTATRTVGGVTTPALKGVWRKIMLFGRGIAGSQMTALDVTSPGPYTRTTKDTGSSSIIGPVVLWTRGNYDTNDGKCKSGSAGCATASNSYNNTLADYSAYLKMGQTWSMPAVTLVDRLNTVRKPCTGGTVSGTDGVCVNQTVGGVNMVAIVGSGYGTTGANPAQGATLFTLDLLTGDVVQTADVGSRTSPPSYTNALVAPPAAYVPATFIPTGVGHPMNDKATRVYIGDLHGRLWKFLTPKLATPILFADFGPNQPIASPVGLLALPFGSGVPHIYAETGNDTRANSASTGAFRLAAFRDDQSDTDATAPSPAVTASTITGCESAPALPCLFAKDFVTDFRGTVQPATVYSLDPVNGSEVGRVFFVGTRLVPPPPLSPFSTQVGATGGPCTSRFDSIVYALTGEAGSAAYDLNASGTDDYVIINNSRIVGLTTPGSQTSSGSQLTKDEGIGATAVSGGVGVVSGQTPPPDKGALQSTSGNVSITSLYPNPRVCGQ